MEFKQTAKHRAIFLSKIGSGPKPVPHMFGLLCILAAQDITVTNTKVADICFNYNLHVSGNM